MSGTTIIAQISLSLKLYACQRRILSSANPRGGGTLIFSYIRRLGSFFLGKIFEFQYFFGFSEK